MSIPQFSIRSIMFAVVLVAANCAVVPSVFVLYAPLGFIFGVFGILPMANILAIACYRNLSRRTAGRAFFVGFAVTGALVVVVWFNVCMTANENRLVAFNIWMNRTVKELPFVQDVASLIGSTLGSNIYNFIIYLLFFILLTTLPQLLLALMAGCVARRFTAAVARALPACRTHRAATTARTERFPGQGVKIGRPPDQHWSD